MQTHSDKEKKTEIAAVLLTGFLKFVFMDWLQLRLFFILAACLFWIIYIWTKHKKHPDLLKHWGFQKNQLRKPFLILLPLALISIAGIIIHGLAANAELFNWHILPVFALYPLWGIIQQFMVAGLIAGNLISIKSLNLTEARVVLFTSLFFSLVHYPSIPLMIYVFIMEMLFIMIYLKWRNLWILGLYHGWVSGLFIYYVLGRDLWVELWSVF